MNYKHQNKLVLLTGASSGIGYNTAIEFSNKGCKLALIGRSANSLNELTKKIMLKNKDVEYFLYDLEDIKSVKGLIEKIETHFNQSIDIFIHCAGYAVLGNILNVPIDDYIKNINVNTFSAISITKAILSKMKIKKNGQLIFIASGIGKRALPGASSYAISKFSLNAFCESLRVELFKYNINVIVISPGLVASNFQKNIKTFGTLKETFTSGKKENPKYIAKQIFLSSLLKKRYISLSTYSSFGVLINFFFPKLMDLYLSKKINK